MEGEALQVRTELARDPQAPADVGDDPRANLVVSDEGHVARALRAGLRLADIVEEGAEAEGVAAVELVRERLGQEGIDLGGELSGETLHVPLEAEPLLQHGDGVAVDVEVVVRVLDDA